MAAVYPPSHVVSVLLCSGPSAGMVIYVPIGVLVHRRKKLDIGAHVLLRHDACGRRRKGVIVHMHRKLFIHLF